jgi:hypothetical protein
MLLMLLAAAAAVAVLWRRYRGRSTPSLSGDPVFAVGFAAAVAVLFWGDSRIAWSGLHPIVSSVGLPTVLAGGAGLLLSAVAMNRRTAAHGLFLTLVFIVFAQVMLAPHATPVPIWSVRRSVTVVLPALCLGLAILCQWVARRWHWALAVVLFAAGIGGQLPASRLLWAEPNYQGARRHVAAVAALIPPGAVVLYDSGLAGSGLAPMLWARRDAPAFFISPSDTTRIAELAHSLRGRPIYWINNGSNQPPRGDGIVAVPVALYEFVLTTPRLEIAAAPGVSATWDYPIGIYMLRMEDDANKNAGVERR